MLDPTSLSAIGDGYTTAYYLVHSMVRGGDSDYEQRDALAASNFARFATATFEQALREAIAEEAHSRRPTP